MAGALRHLLQRLAGRLEKPRPLSLEELLESESFQIALDKASYNINIPLNSIDDIFDHKSDWKFKDFNQALETYRVNLIIETREFLSKLLKAAECKKEIEKSQT